MAAERFLLLEPKAFAYNLQTAGSNVFQNYQGHNTALMAAREFEQVINTLDRASMDLHVFEDDDLPPKPDAVFLNNWFSTHPDGNLVIYPMMSKNRRAEVRFESLEWLHENYKVNELIDLRDFISYDKYLEGTGSLVFDHSSKKVYASLSARTSSTVASQLAEQLGYEALFYKALGPENTPIYHTNVVQFFAHGLAGLCTEIIEEKKAVVKAIEESDKQLFNFNYEQLTCFAGNMLAMNNSKGEAHIACSQKAWDSLDSKQKRTLEQHGNVLLFQIPTIEHVGGGSIRCMIAENYLPTKT